MVKLLHVKDKYPYRYLSLNGAPPRFFNRDQQRPPMPSNATVLLDIVCGIRFVHSNGLAHRNIYPKNIMISSTLPVVIKLAEFGLCKSVNHRGSHSHSQDQGGVCYKAPEILKDDPEKRGSIASDTFSAGLVFFFYISKGFHLFGYNQFLIKINILLLGSQSCQDNDGHQYGVNCHSKELPDEEKHFETIIKSMIKPSPGDRACLSSVESILSDMVGVQDRIQQYIQNEEEIVSFDYST